MVHWEGSLLLPLFTLLQRTVEPLSLAPLALSGENIPQRVTWPSAQQPVPSCAGPGHRAHQTTGFDSLLQGCQVELLPHTQLQWEGWRGHGFLHWRRNELAESPGGWPTEWWGDISGLGVEVFPGRQGAHLMRCHPGSGWQRGHRGDTGGGVGEGCIMGRLSLQSSAGWSQLLWPWQGEHRASQRSLCSAKAESRLAAPVQLLQA